MDKALVEIFLPAVNAGYDVYIPLQSRMSEVSLLVSRVMRELTEGRYMPADDSILCDRKTGNIFNVNSSIAELGIKNGSQLMLI